MRKLLLLLLAGAVLGCSSERGSLVGKEAPAFTLPGSDGKTYSLADYKGRQAVVMVWFPKAFTDHCTQECKSLRDTADALKQYDVALFAASVDDPQTNARFASSLKLNYPILSDPQRTVATAYGVMGKKFAQRHTVYIDKSGRVAGVDTKINAATAGQDVAAQLERLNVPKRSSP